MFCKHQSFHCSPWKRSQRSSYFPAACGGDHARAGGYYLKEVWPMEVAHRSQFTLKNFSPWKGPMLNQGKSARRKE